MNPALDVLRAPGAGKALLLRVLARPWAALEALRTRDRLCLGGAMLALAVGGELLIVMPLRDKREAIEVAVLGGATDKDLASALRQSQRQQRDDALQRRSDKVAGALAAAGASAAPRESLRFLLTRTLQGLPVQLLSLRAAAVEEIAVEPAAPADAVAVVGAAGAADAASAAAAAPPMYRHRYELRVSGALPDLLSVVDALERQARPLRVERVLLRADAQGALEASITLVALGSDRTWLSL